MGAGHGRELLDPCFYQVYLAAERVPFGFTDLPLTVHARLQGTTLSQQHVQPA